MFISGFSLSQFARSSVVHDILCGARASCGVSVAGASPSWAGSLAASESGLKRPKIRARLANKTPIVPNTSPITNSRRDTSIPFSTGTPFSSFTSFCLWKNLYPNVISLYKPNTARNVTTAIKIGNPSFCASFLTASPAKSMAGISVTITKPHTFFPKPGAPGSGLGGSGLVGSAVSAAWLFSHSARAAWISLTDSSNFSGSNSLFKNTTLAIRSKNCGCWISLFRSSSNTFLASRQT